MIMDATLRCLTPEMHNVRVISISEDARIWKIIRKKISRPIAFALFVVESVLGIACEAVHKDDTGVGISSAKLY